MDMIRYDSKLQLRKIPIKYPELTNKKVPAQKDSDGKFYYSGYKNVKFIKYIIKKKIWNNIFSKNELI